MPMTETEKLQAENDALKAEYGSIMRTGMTEGQVASADKIYSQTKEQIQKLQAENDELKKRNKSLLIVGKSQNKDWAKDIDDKMKLRSLCRELVLAIKNDVRVFQEETIGKLLQDPRIKDLLGEE